MNRSARWGPRQRPGAPAEERERSRAPRSALRRLSAILSLLVLACAQVPPPLPAVVPSQLPDAWLRALSQDPSPPPFRARLILRVDLPEEPPFTLEGALDARLPDSLHVSARLGAFRPVFALTAEGDSCLYLDHESSRYWESARSEVDWAQMNPSAWTDALSWALRPPALLEQMIPDGPGRVDEDHWTLTGPIRGTAVRARVGLDLRRRVLREVCLERGGREEIQIRFLRPSRFEAGWLPSVIEIERPIDGMFVRAELRGLRVQTGGAGWPGRKAPAGWTRVEDPLRPQWIPAP